MANVGGDELIDSSGSGVFDNILHFSLFVGAIFQLVCIFSVIFLPSTSEEKVINHTMQRVFSRIFLRRASAAESFAAKISKKYAFSAEILSNGVGVGRAGARMTLGKRKQLM